MKYQILFVKSTRFIEIIVVVASLIFFNIEVIDWDDALGVISKRYMF